MRRKSSIELHVNHDRWLVSYSDFVTLLFAFFVVMYSISQVNEGKYRVLSSTLLEAFKVPQSAISPIQVGSPSLSVSPSTIEVSEPQSPGQTSVNQSNQGEQNQTLNSMADLSELAEQFSEQFSDLMKDDLLRVNANELWLELELKDSILFPTASASPSLQAKGIFEEVAQMLSGFNNPVQVEGFTDNVPINNNHFSSNWELSAARSASVVKILANNGVSPQRLAAVGYGEFQPIADNSTEQGRAQNRRVVLMIARDNSARPQISGEEQVESAIGRPEAEHTKPVEPVTIDQEADLQTPDAGSDDDTQIDTKAGTKANTKADTKTPAIVPVRLRGGGLLFSSDPDLPRNNEVEQGSAAEQNEPQSDTSSP